MLSTRATHHFSLNCQKQVTEHSKYIILEKTGKNFELAVELQKELWDTWLIGNKNLKRYREIVEEQSHYLATGEKSIMQTRGAIQASMLLKS